MNREIEEYNSYDNDNDNDNDKKINKSKNDFKESINHLWEKYDLESKKYNSPIKHAYAMTVHKAQGSTYKKVFIGLDNIYSCLHTKLQDLSKSTYTSVTRAQDSIIIKM